MERTDWLDGGLDPTGARFLMLTAITHHRFTSPIWGEARSASCTPNSPKSTCSGPGRSTSTTSRGGPCAQARLSAERLRHAELVPVRCLLVDDFRPFLDAARGVLDRDGVAVAGTASSTAEALRQASALSLDVAVVDIGLGDENGFDLANRLAERGIAVIMTSTSAESDYADLIAESPVAGFLPKAELSAAPRPAAARLAGIPRYVAEPPAHGPEQEVAASPLSCIAWGTCRPVRAGHRDGYLLMRVTETRQRRNGGRLGRRALGVSVLLSTVIGTAFLLLMFAIDALRDLESRANHALEVQVAANLLERLTIDIETSERGFIITGDPQFLEPWRQAQTQFTQQAAALERLARAGDPEPGIRAHQITDGWRGLHQGLLDPAGGGGPA